MEILKSLNQYRVLQVLLLSTVLTTVLPLQASLRCENIFKDEIRAAPSLPANIPLTTSAIFETFLEGTVRRSTLMKFAQLGNFQGQLDRFYNEALTRKNPEVYKLKDGSEIKVHAETRNLSRNDLPGILIEHGTESVYIQQEQFPGPTSNRFKIVAIEKGAYSSLLEYSVISHQEAQARFKQSKNRMTDLLDGMSPEQLEWLSKKLNGVPDAENPRPAKLHSKPEDEPAPLIPFKSFIAEARARVEWPSLNSGGSLTGFKVVARLLDALYAGEANARRIEALPESFKQVYNGYIQNYIVKANVSENLRYIARNVNGNDTRVVEYFSAQINSKAEIGKRAVELADIEYYGGFNEGSSAFTQLPEGRYLTMKVGHYFQAIELSALERGEINAYVRNLQSGDDKQTYHFSFAADGRPRTQLNESSSRDYIATHVFLEDLLAFQLPD